VLVVDGSKGLIITGADALDQKRIAVTRDLHGPDGTTFHPPPASRMSQQGWRGGLSRRGRPKISPAGQSAPRSAPNKPHAHS
jgi:hypothetical protein